MTLLNKRPGTALVVVDVQVEPMQGAWRRDEVIANVVALVEAARDGGRPVVWVQHSDDWLVAGTPEWQLVSQLVPRPDEARVEKHYGDSFEDTDLDSVLEGLEVGHVVVCGAQTDACIVSTLFGGFVRGYDVTLARDAHTSPDRTDRGLPDPETIAATVNRIWAGRRAPGRTARIARTEDLAVQLRTR